MQNWVLLSAFFIMSLYASAQDSVTANKILVEGNHVRLSFERPAAQDSVFGIVVPFGKIWSAGGKSATQITFEKDANFGGLPVKAGNYTMLVIPDKKEWTIILNSSVTNGIFDYQSNRDKDVLKVTVPTRSISNKVRELTYRFSDTRMIIEWGNTQVLVPVSF
jgi:hypothetical protein